MILPIFGLANLTEIFLACVVARLNGSFWFFIEIYPVRFFYLDQIGDIFTKTILTENCNSKYISEEDSKKILNNIYWDDKNHTVKSVECSYDNENWINKHVKVAVYLETSEGKKEVYYKCYFKIVGVNIYITQIGIYLDEEGSVTDLD